MSSGWESFAKILLSSVLDVNISEEMHVSIGDCVYFKEGYAVKTKLNSDSCLV